MVVAHVHHHAHAARFHRLREHFVVGVKALRDDEDVAGRLDHLPAATRPAGAPRAAPGAQSARAAARESGRGSARMPARRSGRRGPVGAARPSRKGCSCGIDYPT
jgi:hypothetical protein